jgi:23S rRNA pseudouridine955/2504/2580 synthase
MRHCAPCYACRLLTLLIRTAARTLSDQWMNHEVRKLYWAVVLGKPRHKSELIKTKLTRITSPGSDGHKVEVIPLGEDSGRTFGESDSKVAVTQYDLIARSGDAIAFVALKPRTGRTHQLRGSHGSSSFCG